ncbi:hypothetical protein, partial [Paenibacillus solani]|uniref:hypothetical protein n=1 Tax=Paenibacillus solani TaxID=1705565 RepID=UPI003D2C7DF0
NILVRPPDPQAAARVTCSPRTAIGSIGSSRHPSILVRHPDPLGSCSGYLQHENGYQLIAGWPMELLLKKTKDRLYRSFVFLYFELFDLC